MVRPGDGRRVTQISDMGRTRSPAPNREPDVPRSAPRADPADGGTGWQADLPVDAPATQAGVRDILIVDGTFLQRPELRDAWDVIVFVDVDAAIALDRGVSRDSKHLGGQAATAALFRDRYAAAYDIYDRV